MYSEIKIFETSELLASSFAEYFTHETEQKQKYNFVLSGGSTPKIIFKVLSDNYVEKIDWRKIHFYWGDERCVPPDSNESNYKMAKETLFDKIDIPETNIHRIRGEDEPTKEAVRYSNLILKELPKKNNLPRFDLIMLGLGEDGHTASIFPDRIDLFKSAKICEAVKNPLTKQNRITLTGRVINNSSQIAFFVTGEEKSIIVSKILDKVPEKNNFPASYVDPDQGVLIWYLDKKSSSKLAL